MKTNRWRRAPLCERSLEILEEARTHKEGDGPLVFTHRGPRVSRDTVAIPGVAEGGCLPLQHPVLGQRRPD